MFRYKRKGKIISINASPATAPSPTPPSDAGAEVLEAVAKDLMKMGDDLDRQMNNDKSDKSDAGKNDGKTKPTDPLKGIIFISFTYSR